MLMAWLRFMALQVLNQLVLLFFLQLLAPTSLQLWAPLVFQSFIRPLALLFIELLKLRPLLLQEQFQLWPVLQCVQQQLGSFRQHRQLVFQGLTCYGILLWRLEFSLSKVSVLQPRSRAIFALRLRARSFLMFRRSAHWLTRLLPMKRLGPLRCAQLAVKLA